MTCACESMKRQEEEERVLVEKDAFYQIADTAALGDDRRE